MCGIAGIFNLDHRGDIDEGLLHAMTNVLVHRGPDDGGYYTNGRIGLGHRRLSIIDLNTGRQPLSNSAGTVRLVVNGEIYNYRELRRELRSFGHTFRTRTDSEVILHSYEQWGIDCLSRFNGMFAFAIWDSGRSRLVLARDRLGIKPLYTTMVDGTLLFASEVKSLLMHPRLDREVDPEGISSYLGYRCVLGGGTLFRNIEKLMPGHALVYENGCLAKIRYWDIPIDSERKDLGEEHYVRSVRRLLFNSVHRRLMSDVPLGAYLSGGLDSSIIVSIMAQLERDPVKTYTIAFPEEGFDEREHAIAVARRYDTDHREIVIDDGDYIEMIPALIRAKDAPLSVANEVPLHLMSKELKKEITVVLSGEGADELFAGYGRIFRSPFDYKRARFLESNGDLLPEYRGHLLDKIKDIYGTSHFLNELDHFIRKYHWVSAIDKENFLTEKILKDIDGDTAILEFFSDQFDKAGRLSHYDKILYIFQKVHLENLLMRVDMTTMATSVEARVPFVDHELVEFVFNIPFHHKIRWKSRMHETMAAMLTSDELSENHDTTKYILRKAFSNDLPESIINRKKMGFPVPLDRWFGGRYTEFVKDILLDPRTAARGVFNVPALEAQLRGDRAKEHSTALKMWMFMNLELWFRSYIDEREGGMASLREGHHEPEVSHREAVSV